MTCGARFGSGRKDFGTRRASGERATDKIICRYRVLPDAGGKLAFVFARFPGTPTSSNTTITRPSVRFPRASASAATASGTTSNAATT